MKSYKEINEKIKSGNAVVVTAEEIIDIVEEKGLKEAAKIVDVITTATFGPMCSSGVFLNFGHSDPPIRISKLWLNDVPAYAGIAAVDAYIGATELAENMRSNEVYGGAHVIEDLVKRKDVKLRAIGTGTDCYPKKDISGYINLEDINEAIMLNPRNLYQNYAAAINLSKEKKETYMGTLLPNGSNITYSTSGQLSPLLNDPEFDTIGIGTRIFFAGSQGYVAWNGTQHNTTKDKKNNVPTSPGATLTLIGDLKEMKPEFLKAAYFKGYGVSLFVGIGIPIPVLNEEVLAKAAIKDEELFTNVFDYGVGERSRKSIAQVSYKELKSGSIEINGKKIKTAPLSSMRKAREIASLLKEEIRSGNFLLTEPSAPLRKNTSSKPMKLKEEQENG